MKDSTALILSSLAFNALTIISVISGLPVACSAVICFWGAALLGLGFYNLANDN